MTNLQRLGDEPQFVQYFEQHKHVLGVPAPHLEDDVAAVMTKVVDNNWVAAANTLLRWWNGGTCSRGFLWNQAMVQCHTLDMSDMLMKSVDPKNKMWILQRMLGCVFIDACGKLPWNEVQQWRALSDCSMYSKDALLEALRYNKLDNCEQLWPLFKDKADVRLLCDMVAEAASGICAEGILWAMDQADDDDQKFQMVMRLCHFHWDKINKMEAPLIEGLSQRFSAEQIKDVLSIAQYNKTIYFQDDKMEIMTPFLNAVLAHIERGVLTSHMQDAGLNLRKGLKL